MCSTCATLDGPRTTPGWGTSWWTPGGQGSLQGSLHTQQCPCCPVGLGAVQSAPWQAPQQGRGMSVTQPARMQHLARPLAPTLHVLLLPRHVLHPTACLYCSLQQGQSALPWPGAAHGAPGPV